MTPRLLPDRRLLTIASIAATLLLIASVGAAGIITDTVTPGLLWSASSDRTDPEPLDGASLDRDAHVQFLGLDGHASVEFWLDGRLVRTDDEAPFDLVGGDLLEAQPLVHGALRQGGHELSVRATTLLGSTDTFTASFTTDLPVDGFDPLVHRFDWQTGALTADADLTPVDSVRYHRNVTMLQGVHVRPGAQQTAQGTQLTVRDARIEAFLRADERYTPSHVVLEDCTSTAPGRTAFGMSIEVRGCDITGDNDGLSMQSGPNGTLFASGEMRASVIEYNWLHGPGEQVGFNHHDGVQLWQGRDLTIRRNWIDDWHTSAILLKSDYAPIDNVRIEENYLEGSGFYAVYVRDGGFGRPTKVTITDNVFGRASTPISSGVDLGDEAVYVRTEAERQAAVDDGDATAAEWIVWSGNTWADTGQEIAPPGGWHTYPVDGGGGDPDSCLDDTRDADSGYTYWLVPDPSDAEELAELEALATELTELGDEVGGLTGLGGPGTAG